MYYTIWRMSWGWMGALGDEKGLAYLTLPKETKELAYQELKKHATEEFVENPSFFAAWCHELDCYFKAEPFDFDRIPLQWDRVTSYRRKVLAKTREIPYGETRTYKWLAEQVGKPKGARSVGQVMANNPWPIIVPCHRVIGSDGKLTGFGGGLAMKQKLLALESKGAK